MLRLWMNIAIAFVVSIPMQTLSIGSVFADEPLKNGGQLSVTTQPSVEGKLSVEVARERAMVTQDIYAATLKMLHHRYFRQDKKVLPARAMQDIFSDIESQTNVKARWISASLKPMSIDHTPETAFEKKAAKEIADGSQQLEVVEDGYYRRAVAIPLTGGCLGCHEGLFQNSSKKQFAGLIVSIPLQKNDARVGASGN